MDLGMNSSSCGLPTSPPVSVWKPARLSYSVTTRVGAAAVLRRLEIDPKRPLVSSMESSAPPTKRRAKQHAEDSQDGAEVAWCWSKLPALALEAVFGHLGTDDLVSAGQTCRSWRAAAKQPRLWETRTVLYSTVFELLVRMDLPRKANMRHRDAREFARAVRFAPCLHWDFAEAVSNLMERFADTLEEVHVSCLPRSAALARCTRLRTLGVNLDPASAEDRSQLLAGLRGKKLKFIGFKGRNDWERHSKEDCKGFRQQLKTFVFEDVLCRMCL